MSSFTINSDLPPCPPPIQNNYTISSTTSNPQNAPPRGNEQLVLTTTTNGGQVQSSTITHQQQPGGSSISQHQHGNNSRQQQQQGSSNIQQQQGTTSQQRRRPVQRPQVRRRQNEDTMLVALQQQQAILKLREWVTQIATNDQPETPTNEPLPAPRIKQRRLTNEEKSAISQTMFLSYRNGKLKHGHINELSLRFGVTRLTISKIWKDVHEQLKAGKVINVTRKYKGRKTTRFIDVEKVKSIELKDRMCLKDLAFGLGLPITTVWRLVQKGEMKSHTSDIKPSLTAQNKITRLHWVLSKISASSLRGNLVFDAMYDVVHIDEKHFYLTRATTKYYVLPNEPKPHRTCQSKRFITKVMFMAAVARPRYDEDGVCLFDGKIGIFPFIYEVEAMRSSKNREKGTLEVKPIESITKEVVKQCLLEKVIPAIKAKWPLDASGKIWIQQDNAKPHISPKDLDFLSVAKSDGFDMDLICQPPNSPDLNILDLGFFRSIQTLQHKKSSKSILELVNAVGRAYDEIDNEKLKFVWVSLHACMNEILRAEGGNSYPIPHVGKKKLDKNRLLENKVKPNMVCLERALYALENMNNNDEAPTQVQVQAQTQTAAQTVVDEA